MDLTIDFDTQWFYRVLQEKPPARVLEVGAWDELIAETLAGKGFDVVGVDLHQAPPGVRYAHVVGDFVRYTSAEKFDVAVSTSAIEHFGLNTYGESILDPDYDVKAMEHIHDLLKLGGACYITVPFGARYFVHGNDWRVYDPRSLQRRIVQDFAVSRVDYFLSDWWGNLPPGSVVFREKLLEIQDQPNGTVGLRLVKQ